MAAEDGQLQENVAGALCYVLGWITGLIFLVVDKRPFVRFHAAQSIVVFGGLTVLSWAAGIFFGFSLFAGGMWFASPMTGVFSLIRIAAFVLWIVLMIKAYQGERFRIPVAADLADQFFGKP